uniref:C2cd2 like n=1 Tax=Erpetoichthys calabaricus TaxID=27687 RepID=A0A8C4SRR9_ERPCA
MELHAGIWPLLIALFLVSLFTLFTWLLRFSVSMWGRWGRRGDSNGLWGSVLRADGESHLALRELLVSLFSFKSFRENWQRTWVQALNEQACRIGSSIQITFENSLQLPSTAAISQVLSSEQCGHSMVLQCQVAVDVVTLTVTVTQQSPAAVSMDTYLVSIAPLQAQLQVCLEETMDEGLLVSWTFSERPLLCLTVKPCLLQREGSDNKVDMDIIRELVEDTIISTQPAMVINLRASVSTSLDQRLHSEWEGRPITTALRIQQLRACNIFGIKDRGQRELCCILELDHPTQQRSTSFQLPTPDLDWNEDFALVVGAKTSELKIRLMERSMLGSAYFLPGLATLALDPSSQWPTGQQVVSLYAAPGERMLGTVSLELLYVDNTEPHEVQTGSSTCKKVELDRTIMPDGTIVTTVTTIQSRPKLDPKLDSPSRVEVTENTTVTSESSESLQSSSLDPVSETAIRQLTESASKVNKKTPTKRSTLIISGVSKVPIMEEEAVLSIGCAMAMDNTLKEEPGASPGANNQRHESSRESLHFSTSQSGLQEPDETTPSDISERPSVDDMESETGSTGALETRSLKDHKVGFLRSGTKLLFRRRHRQKEPGYSQSHEDVSNVSEGATGRKKSGSFSRRLIKHFSFRSKTKSKSSANGTAGSNEN